MKNSSTGNTDNLETKELSNNESYSFEYNGETFIYPESVLDIVKFYRGEMSYDDFYNKYKNHNYISINGGFITIILINNNEFHLNYDGIKYYIMKCDINLTLKNFLENCKNGNLNILDIKRKTEITCILHFLENENNLEQFKSSVELPNIGIEQQNSKTESVVEGNKGKVKNVLKSKDEKLTDKEIISKIRELHEKMKSEKKQNEEDINKIKKLIENLNEELLTDIVKQYITFIKKIYHIENTSFRKITTTIEPKNKKEIGRFQKIENIRGTNTKRITEKSEPQENNGGVIFLSKEEKARLNDKHKKEIITNSDNGIQESLEKSTLEGEQVIRQINEYKERIIKLKERFERLIGDKKNIKELKLNKEKIELIEKIINAIKTLNKAKKELESKNKSKDKDNNYNEKDDPIKKLITVFENILKELKKNNN